jgi:CRISPR-associated protein Cas5d
MIDGKIDLIKPKACNIRKLVRPMKANPPKSVGLEEEGLMEGFEEWEVHK